MTILWVSGAKLQKIPKIVKSIFPRFSFFWGGKRPGRRWSGRFLWGRDYGLEADFGGGEAIYEHPAGQYDNTSEMQRVDFLTNFRLVFIEIFVLTRFYSYLCAEL